MSDYDAIWSAVFLVFLICIAIIVSPINGIITLITWCVIAYFAFQEHKK